MLPWYLDHPKAASDDILQIKALIQQARNAMEKASLDGDLTSTAISFITASLDAALEYISSEDLTSAQNRLSSACLVID